MFDKFGELNSAEEINQLAENLFNEGDIDSLRELAAENGLANDFVEMYVTGDIPTLCDALSAAIGKLDVEAKDMKAQEIMEDWVEYIRSQCWDDDLMAFAVRKKGKSLKGCIAQLLKWSFGHQQDIDKEILKAAGVNASRVTLGIPGMGQAKKIIRKYYLGR